MATKKAVGKRTRGTGRTKEELESFYSLIPEQHGRSICFRAVQCSTRSIGFYCIPVDDDDIGAADDGQLPPELLYGKQPKRILALLNTTNISRSSTFEAVGIVQGLQSCQEAAGSFQRSAEALWRQNRVRRWLLVAGCCIYEIKQSKQLLHSTDRGYRRANTGPARRANTGPARSPETKEGPMRVSRDRRGSGECHRRQTKAGEVCRRQIGSASFKAFKAVGRLLEASRDLLKLCGDKTEFDDGCWWLGVAYMRSNSQNNCFIAPTERFNFNPGGRKYIKRPQGGRKYIKKPQGGRKYPKFVKEQAMN
ncbi:hypothetical protein RHGRI_016540 [Rhododendron griersonianum]|uniref:Uncharacterized protein n=1 Tax=Rhododendron griersonianum TaxID=479676 RepID=A0AAV6JUF9_9ERIC|nr:hypothetical protein RHGRI_016540 [Rhododendron griersonianum]